jgi:hypothetical protein
MDMGISKTCSFWCQNLRGAQLQKLINPINFQYPPQFLFWKQKIRYKGVCRGVELTMMKANNSNNNDSNGTIVVKLV